MPLFETFNLELDGQLTGANGASTVVYCRIQTPLVRHAPSKIELSIPHACMPAPILEDPCIFEGYIGSGDEALRVRLEDAVLFTYTTDCSQKSKLGLAPITLTHVGKLIIQSDEEEVDATSASRPATVIKFFITTPEFFKKILEWKLLEPRGGARLLFTLEIPSFGLVEFTRYWACRFGTEQDTFSGSAGTYASVTIQDFDAKKITDYVVRFREALLVISMLCRQQIQLVGWDIEGEQVRVDPLKPLLPPYVPPEPNDFMVRMVSKDLVSAAEQALRVFFSLDAEAQHAIKLMIVGAAPFVEMADSQRFMAIIHGFEWLPLPEGETPRELSDNDKSLIAALEGAKTGLCEEVAERINGFINKVTGQQKNFAAKMRRLPMEKGILVGDLWPLHRSGKKLGLVDIRDRLAHSGPSSLHHSALAVATWHLGILAERTVLTMLNVDLNQTRLTPSRLSHEYWYKRAVWTSEQERVRREL